MIAFNNVFPKENKTLHFGGHIFKWIESFYKSPSDWLTQWSPRVAFLWGTSFLLNVAAHRYSIQPTSKAYWFLFKCPPFLGLVQASPHLELWQVPPGLPLPNWPHIISPPFMGIGSPHRNHGWLFSPLHPILSPLRSVFCAVSFWVVLLAFPSLLKMLGGGTVF